MAPERAPAWRTAETTGGSARALDLPHPPPGTLRRSRTTGPADSGALAPDMGEGQTKPSLAAGPGAHAEEVSRRRDAPPEPRPGRTAGADPGPDGAGALLNAIREGLCLADASGHTLWSNPAFRALDPQVRSQVEMFCHEAAAIMARQIGGRGGEPVERTYHLSTPDGARHYEIVVSPAGAGAEGRTPGADRVIAVVHDVTGDRRTRMKMEAIDRAGAELVRFDADTVRKLNVMERLGLLESRIVKCCRDLLRFDNFAIRLIDERTGRLEQVISSGRWQEAAELEIYPLPEGNGISGYVAATGLSYICRDTETDPLFLPGLAGARSSLTVPLRLHDKVIGTLDVESQQVGAFGEEDRQFGEMFARYVALAIHLLNLLVVERTSTNESVSGRVEGEINEPLADILVETDWLRELASRDPEAARHVERIRQDVESIRRRVRDVASGPQTLLGVERAMLEREREPLLENRRILVADDEARVRRIIHDVLQNRGCVVVTAESGAQAIEALEHAAPGAGGEGAGGGFDLVLSDIKMPDRNGYEVFAASRRLLPGVPVILMTGFGYDPHHSIVRASQEGLQSVLFKPFPVERLLEEVRKAVLARVGGGGAVSGER